MLKALQHFVLFRILRFLPTQGKGSICKTHLWKNNALKMFSTKSLYDEHDCNVVSMNSLDIFDANDMQSHKLGDAMFDEDDIFCPPIFDEQIYFY